MNNIFQILRKSKIEFKYKKMQEICLSISSGLNPRQNFKLNTADAKNYYVTVKEISTNNIIFSEKTDLINDEAFHVIQKRSKLEKNDLLLSSIGTIGKVAIANIKTDNWNCSESVLLIKPNQNLVTSKFLRYFLLTDSIQQTMINSSVGSTLKGIRKEWLNNLLVPIPPMEVQNEIVRILDKYTELEKELEKELELRTKQYEYYRDRLFNTLNNNLSIFKSINELCIFNPKSKLGVKKVEGQNIDGEVPFFTSGKKILYIDNFIVQDENIFMNDGGTADFKFYKGAANYSDHVISFKSKDRKIILNKFLYYSLLIKKEYINNEFFVGSGLKNISKKEFSNFYIPVPSLKEQQRIVNILDKFSNIINDLNDGIPKQIQLLNKQYLYFRNKLLDFETGGLDD